MNSHDQLIEGWDILVPKLRGTRGGALGAFVDRRREIFGHQSFEQLQKFTLLLARNTAPAEPTFRPVVGEKLDHRRHML